MAALSGSTVLLWAFLGSVAPGEGDWPLWRHDASRSACTRTGLDAFLRLHWVRELPPPRPAWPDQPRLQFDVSPRPVIAGTTLVVGLSGEDVVVALDTRTGREKWRRFTEGPVRMPPAIWGDLVLVASDDGRLYALDLLSGEIRWRFRGGPEDRRILGNGRLISAWPARGGPVVADGIVYFAAGLWPFMGISLHALEVSTGRPRWSNEGDGPRFTMQPHRAESFGGVVPQGPLAVAGNRLLVPGGRSVPACYDRTCGRLIHYRPGDSPRLGGFEVVSAGPVYFVDGTAFELESGLRVGELGESPVVSGPAVAWIDREGNVRRMDLPPVEMITTEDRRGRITKRLGWRRSVPAVWRTPGARVLIRAGDRIYGGGDRRVWALETSDGQVRWTAEVEGTVLDLAAADGRLFASTREGLLYCFGPGEREPVVHRSTPAGLETPDSAEILRRLERSGVRDGYAMVWGVGDGRWIEGLARHGDFHTVAVEPDSGRVEEMRRRMFESGLYGNRVALHVGDPFGFPFPPYFASLAVIDDSLILDRKGAEHLWSCLRPFGGTAWMSPRTARAEDLIVWLPESRVGEADGWVWLIRPGPPPGSGEWTHEHADAANTRVSADRRVRAPLGILWFGGSSSEGILPRHGHGPQPQSVDGRIFIEGRDRIRALDLYTGRVLWEAPLPGVGAFFDSPWHQPGANASGSNFVSVSDGIYVAWGRVCVRLDPATGRKLSEFRLPPRGGSTEIPAWGYLSVVDDLLIGGAEPRVGRMAARPEDPRAGDDDPDEGRSGSVLLARPDGSDPDNLSSSRRLVVMDRYHGQVLWELESQLGFRHNGICAGGGRLYAIDRLPGTQDERRRREGRGPTAEPRLRVVDLRSGRELWTRDQGGFGTWLSYSSAHDLLVEAGRPGRDTLPDEPRGMRVYRASDGAELWHRKDLSGPAMIHGDRILTPEGAYDLRSGATRYRYHPFTGRPEALRWWRGYGCNTPAASENLLTFRSGAAGYYDLEREGGTGNFGGFRSGCSHNLVVAGGVIGVPDYTRTCLCSYSNQTSLALVPMSRAEMWTCGTAGEAKDPILRLGVNLGAPGDRRAEDGTLWIEHPSVGGRSPSVNVRTVPERPPDFRLNSLGVEGEGIPWVAASGLKGLRSLSLTLDREGRRERRYDVRLHFLEPETLGVGDRVFHVSLQGRRVLENFDVVREAGGPRRAVARSFAGIPVKKDLLVGLEPVRGDEPLLCGIEVSAPFDEPRFRYALECWPADPYEVEVWGAEGVGVEGKRVLARLERAAGRANLVVRRRSDPADGRTGIVLREPVRGEEGGRILWRGPVQEEVVDRLIDSPVRRELVRRLFEGHAAVWIVRGEGTDEGEEAAVARVERALQRARLDLVPGAPGFSLIRLSRRDPEEDFLNRMLDAVTPLRCGAWELFPVFGRGRVIPGRQEGDWERGVAEVVSYVSEAHRGESQRAVPGLDLLLCAPWSEGFGRSFPEGALLRPWTGPEEEEAGESAAAPVGSVPRPAAWIGMGAAVILGGIWLLLLRRRFGGSSGDRGLAGRGPDGRMGR